MQDPQPLDYETPQPPQQGPIGCLVPLVGGLWVLAITKSVGIGTDGLFVPLWLKYVITIGHLSAITAMIYPIRVKPIGLWIGTWILRGLVSLWAALQVFFLWIWN